jgi:hypothetical protein
MLSDGDDLISLLSIIPNIQCLHVSIERTHDTFKSPLWSSIILPDLIEFYLWAELCFYWTMDELVILLSIMRALRRLSLNIVTRDVELLDGDQIRSVLSAVNVLYLDKFNYAVEYCGAPLEHSIIFNLPQKWLPQPIAFIFDTECCNICLYTIPFKFHRFWTRRWTPETKKLIKEQKLTTCFGEGAYITHCSSTIPTELSDLYAVMQKSCHIEKLTLGVSHKTEINPFGK